MTSDTGQLGREQGWLGGKRAAVQEKGSWAGKGQLGGEKGGWAKRVTGHIWDWLCEQTRAAGWEKGS